jgi:glycerophosphoryl diester phosphodiesterase
MAAYRKARDLGTPGIELDVHVCASGELVVAHDDTFNRTALLSKQGDGAALFNRTIEDLTLEVIRTIDVGAFFNPSGTGEHPPLLEEVLEEFCPAMYIDIELKTRKTKNDPLPGALVEKLKALGDRILQSVTISSFNPFSLAAVKRRCPAIPTAIIWSADKDVPFILRHGFGRILSSCDYLKPVHLQVNRLSYFRFTGLEGRPQVPWTIDDPALAEKLFNLGCEGIITNRPQEYE